MIGGRRAKQGLGLLAAGWAALVLQSVAARLAPPALCPELGLLVVVGLGLCMPAPSGLLLAAAIGYATDLLSGSLFGQHALLSVLAFGATRAASRGLNFRGAAARAIYAGLLSAAYAFGLAGLAWLFGLRPVVDAALLPPVLEHALVNALLAPWVCAAVGRLAGILSAEETGRRPLRLAPRGSA